jgi:hypothetical protein
MGTPTVGGPTMVSVLGGDMFSAAVKGAPYSAEGITETTQVLPDGNRTVNRSTTKIYRDSAGRERREQGPATITISDPVVRVIYSLDPSTKTATRLTAPRPVSAFVTGGMVGDGFTSSAPSPAEQREDLGRQIVNGLSAQGTRITTPQTVSETWFSSDLKVVVMSKQTDSHGEIAYRLMNVSRAEPPPSLFEVPARYQVKDAPR